MAKIDVEIFTNEIEKTYTILKQNLIMIDTIKELIAQGNLSEDAIANLNTSRERIYDMINGLEGAIDNTNTTIENMNKVMPTDINVDANKYIILEHDGVEITGQKKKVKLEGTPVYKLNKTFFNSDWSISLTDATDLATIKECLKDALTRPVYLQTKYVNDDSLLTGPVYMLIGYCYQNQYATQARCLIVDMTTGNGKVPSILAITLIGDDIQTDVYSLKLKTIFGNQSLVGTGNINLYRHQLTLTMAGGTQNETKLYCIIYSSNNLNINSLQNLVTVTKATNGYILIGTIDPNATTDANKSYIFVYNGSKWLYNNNFALTAVTDVVKPI